MKLKNKKTEEIVNLDNTYFVVTSRNKNIVCSLQGTTKNYTYNSLSEFVTEWEVYEEPKEYWYIDYDGKILCGESDDSSTEKMMINIGNHFESKEEAEKAVDKLKAYKKLKDNGMIIYSFKREKGGIDLDFYTLTILAPRDKDSLDLLFGGGE